MRKELMLTCALLIPLPMFSSTLLVPRAVITMVAGEHLRKICDGRVDTACTSFDDATLACVCAAKGEQWSPTVHLTVQPRMYLSHDIYLQHELAHIYDFERAMRRHVAGIQATSFPSLSACEAFAAEQSVAFRDVQHDFERASMKLRDGKETLPNRR
jgi:hypothetical protein